MTETLLSDDDGVYDLRLINDRLLLGLKGTMGEFELSLLRQRAREAFEQKVKRGCVLWQVPVGFVRTEEYQVEKAPDRQVQQALLLVFQKFRELGSARQMMLWFRDEHIRLPAVVPGTNGQEIRWRWPSLNQIHQLLGDPAYAGAFAYGRTGTKRLPTEGRQTKALRGGKPLQEWPVLLLDHHAGSITWEEYRRNQQVLAANLARREAKNSGAAKGGSALLSGLLRCGRCGRARSHNNPFRLTRKEVMQNTRPDPQKCHAPAAAQPWPFGFIPNRKRATVRCNGSLGLRLGVHF